jgi:hypothetical protein
MLSPVLPNRLKNPEQENPHVNSSHYSGFDVHKKSVRYCVKIADGKIVEEGQLPATHRALREWAGKRSEAWHGAREATLLSGWMYDTLKPFAAKWQMGNPSRRKAIAAAKKKNDRLDARKIADLERCNRSQRADGIEGGVEAGAEVEPAVGGVYDRERKGGDGNQATLAVARKLVAYLLAVDKSGKRCEVRTPPPAALEEDAKVASNPALSSPAGKVIFPPKPPVAKEIVPERSSLSRVRCAAPKQALP